MTDYYRMLRNVRIALDRVELFAPEEVQRKQKDDVLQEINEILDIASI